MNEQRAFTVVVTGCMGCPHRIGCECNHYPHCANLVKSYRFHDNKDAITPSCPMWSEAKPFIGELK